MLVKSIYQLQNLYYKHYYLFFLIDYIKKIIKFYSLFIVINIQFNLNIIILLLAFYFI